MGRSLQFRVYEHQLSALFRLAFAPAPHFLLNLAGARNSLAHSSIGTPSLALRLLVDIRFQVLFHSAPAVLFTFPSRYWFTIAHSFIFSLGGWSRLLPTRFLVSRRTQDPIRLCSDFGYRAFTFFGRAFDPVLLSSFLPCHGPSTPVLQPVWASPLSLAATQGITVVFFSSGYLDVSVRRVPLLQAMYSPADDSSCLLPGSPIRTPPLLRFLTASRSFSQFGASFFSFEWQGIRRTPFLT